MRINELLLAEFDDEMKTTRTTLERLPGGGGDFRPHAKSTPLGGLAPHVAQLPAFGVTVLTSPSLDFSQGSFTPVAFESAAQLVRVFDDGILKVRRALEGLPESAWGDQWKLSWKGQTLFDGSRFLAYRRMFLNHLVHHRAQLGVYLRLNNAAVPAIYGPSADETLGL